MQVNPYLFFNGQCEEAFKFYEKLLNGKILAMMPHEGSPAENSVSADWRKKIIHARMTVGDQTIMGSDAPPPHQEKPQGFFVNLGFADPAEAKRIFEALADRGTVKMPFSETFWAKGFGMLVDRFGIPWMVNCEKAAEKAA
jgi:PhnB protein